MYHALPHTQNICFSALLSLSLPLVCLCVYVCVTFLLPEDVSNILSTKPDMVDKMAS